MLSCTSRLVKTQDTIAPLLVEPASALGIVLDLITMSVAIDFDDEFGGGAEEVDDEAVNGVLAAEVVGGELATAKVSPQALLCRCHVEPQLAGTQLHSLRGTPAAATDTGHVRYDK